MANKELTEAKVHVLAEYAGFEDFSGEGFAEVTSEDLAIPFLRVLAQLFLMKHMMVNRVFL